MLPQDHLWAADVSGRAQVWADPGAPWHCLFSSEPISGAGIMQGSAPGHLSTAQSPAQQHLVQIPLRPGLLELMAMPSAQNSPCFPLWTPGESKKDPLWATGLLCICIRSEEMKFLHSFAQGWLWAKAAVWGSGLGGCDKINSAPFGLIQGFLSHGKPAWLLPLLPQQRLKKQNCTMVVPKPRTNTSTHIHLSLQGPSSSPPGLSILIQLHPLSCGGSKQPHSFGKPDLALVYYSPYRNLAGLHLGKKKKKKPKRFILQPNLIIFW